MRERRQEKPNGLNPHSRSDQPLSTPPIDEWPRHGLQDSPDSRIDGFQNANSLDAQAVAREEEREDPPAHSIVQVVDQTGLAGRKQVPVAKRGSTKYLPESYRWRRWPVLRDFQRHVSTRISDQQGRTQEAESRIGDAEEEGSGPQPIALG